MTIELAKACLPKEIITALYAPKETFSEFEQYDIKPSWLNLISWFRKDSRIALPLLAWAWTCRSRVTADVVICSSSGWSHGVRTNRTTRKIVYCHNPARWLYQTSDYLFDQRWYIRISLFVLKPFLLWWDRRAARSADIYIANSTSVAKRILMAYGRDSQVIFPPVSVDSGQPREPVPGVEAPFFLMVGRSRGYKGAQPLVDAFRELPDHKLVIAGGNAIRNCPANVLPLGFVTEAQLRWLYANARALVSVSREDFGLTPIEANAFGTPALLLRAGGFLDSTNEGVSGEFIEDTSVIEIKKAVRAFPKDWDREAILRHAEKFSPKTFEKAIKAIIIDLTS